MVTQLPTVTNSTLNDILYAVQGFAPPGNNGTSVQETVQQLLSLITAGPNISTTFNAGNLVISATGLAGIGWNHVTTTSVTLASNAGYVMDNPALITALLPTVAAFGSIIFIQGLGAGGWTITQNASQSIKFAPSTSTTVGTGGSTTNTGQFDALAIVCIVANTTFAAMTLTGNGLTIV